MPEAAELKPDSVVATLESGQRVAVKWLRNRLHYHPRVFRLMFDGFDAVNSEEVDRILSGLLVEALDVLGTHEPLLVRATVNQDSPLLHGLRQFGFVDTLYVYTVAVEVGALSGLAERPGSIDRSDFEVISVSDVLSMLSEDDLVQLFLEVYSRGSRLDPATPERLTASERRELLLEDDALIGDLSSCVVVEKRLVGICPVYQGEDQSELELGPVGVTESVLQHHEQLSLAMLRRTARMATARGVQRLVAEVDSDDPWTMYVYAELPCGRLDTMVSLAFIPKWQGGAVHS